jgi:rod shape-determining protein MreC
VTAFTVRYRIVIVGVVLALCVLLIALDSRGEVEPLRAGIRQVTSPVIGVVDTIVQRSRPKSELERELEAVRRDRDALAAENARLRQLDVEIQQLRELLNVQDTHPEWTLVTARVVSPDPANLQKFITIDKGSDDGIQVGMAVVDPNFFVGLVTEVSPNSAKVTLAIDATASVGAQLIETGAAGVAYGMWQRGGRIELRHVDRGTNPKPNEVVITASDSMVRTSLVPAGLIIGKIDGEPQLDNQTDTLIIQVLPVADFDNLEVVSVIVLVTEKPTPTPGPVAQPTAAVQTQPQAGAPASATIETADLPTPTPVP